MLRRFPSKTRQKWYDPEDAFSDVILEAYQLALKGDLTASPARDHWHQFLHQGMRQKLWLVKRRDRKILTADAGAEAMAEVATDKIWDDPVLGVETRDELGVLMPKVKESLSPKQQVTFFGKAQDLTHKEIACAARTTPGAVRVQYKRAKKKLKKLQEKLKKDRVA